LFFNDLVHGAAIGVDRRLRIRFRRLIAKLNSKGAAAMLLNELIGYNVWETAEWRRRKAVEFPADGRNLQAAEMLDVLAGQVDALEGSEIHKQIDEVAAGINDREAWDVWADISDTVSAELRTIGFHGAYDSALQFLEWYRDLLQEKLKGHIESELEAVDAAVPAVDLDEQVASDPAVKAAKQAYDEARARAYTEARKRL
jgi:hypothetical protein